MRDDTATHSRLIHNLNCDLFAGALGYKAEDVAVAEALAAEALAAVAEEGSAAAEPGAEASAAFCQQQIEKGCRRAVCIPFLCNSA